MSEKPEKFEPETHVEMMLITAIRHEITNFRPRFPFKQVERTYFLTECGSDWFPVEYLNGQIFLCIPEELMRYFCFMDMINISVINKGSPKKPIYDDGFYLVFKIGNRNLRKFGALKIRCSSKRAEAISLSEKVHVVAINDKGESLALDEGRTYFKLFSKTELVKNIYQTTWETL